MKSGSEVAEGVVEREGDSASAVSSDSEGVGDVMRAFVCLLVIEGRLRALVDLIPFLLALSIVFEVLGRGGEKEGRLRLDVVGAIASITIRFSGHVFGLPLCL